MALPFADSSYCCRARHLARALRRAAGALRGREAAQDPGDRVRQVAAVVLEVDVADARAAGGRRAVAGVAVAAADVVHEEAAADAGLVEAGQRGDVGDRLAGARDVGVRRRCCRGRGPTRGRRSPAISPVLRQPPPDLKKLTAPPSQKALQSG